MATDLIVLGRRELPTHDGDWGLELDGKEGAVTLTEAKPPDDVAGRCRKELGVDPRACVYVKNAWDIAYVMGEVLAIAVDGVVVDDARFECKFDANGQAKPPSTMAELEDRLRAAFAAPDEFYDRRKKLESARWQQHRAIDPDLAKEDDWSDL